MPQVRRPPAPALVLLLLGAAAFCLFSCGGEDDTGPDPEELDLTPPPIPNERPVPAVTGLECPAGTTLTYQNFGAAFMLEHCAMCHASTLSGADRHGAPEGVDLDSREGVAIWRGGVLSQAAGLGAKMPPAGSVTAAEKKLLTEWLQCGAPAD
jgi:hypothetical protein